MYRLFWMVAIFVSVIEVVQPSPVLKMSEKEAILRALLGNERFWGLFSYNKETTVAPTTEPPTTPEEPEPVPIISGGSRLTSGQICGIAQSLFPRIENVETKRDFVINLIHHICLPSVGPTDLDAMALILDFLRGEEEEVVVETEAPTTTAEPEEAKTLSPLWQKLKDNLAKAQGSA